MNRVLRLLLVSLAVLFGGVLLLGLLLWWLAQRERAERESAAIEIKIPQDSPVGEPPVLGSAAPAPAAKPQPEGISEPPVEPEGETPVEPEGEAATGAEGEPPVEPEGEAPPPRQQEAPDDLRRIEGVGPKISRVLQAAGITTFGRLAATEVDEIHRILEAEDPRLGRLTDPGTWPEQARLAAKEDWEGLVAFQAQLKGGRRVSKSG